MSSKTSIYAGTLGGTAWVRIVGDANKDTTGGIRRFFANKFSDGLRTFIIDLESCEKVDSTFIGIVIGLAKRMEKEKVEGKVNIIHANDRNTTSISKLGDHDRIKLRQHGRGFEELESSICTHLVQLPDEEMDKVQKSTMILEAHEDLCDGNEENEGQFSDLLFYLRRDLKNSSEG